MDIKEFSRISDTQLKLGQRRASVEKQKADKKISDAKAGLVTKIRDTESDEELIEVITSAAEELPVSDVLETVVEVLSPIVEKLNLEVADARRAVATMRKKMRDAQPSKKPKADAKVARMLTSRMKDDSTTLEDLKSDALDLLETFDPASVVEVIIEAIPSVVESVVAASSTNE